MFIARRVFAVLFALTCGGACSAQAYAQASWPAGRPIRLIVAYPAGGVSDSVARALAEKVSADLKTPVIPENRGGAAGSIGVDVVAKAAADGYTFVFSSISPLALNPHLMKPPFDPQKDIAPVVSVMYSPTILLATTAMPAKDLAGLIAAARDKPGMVTWATSGKGSVGQLMVEQIKRAAHVQIIDVPYKGAGQQMQDALGAQFDVMSVNSEPVLAAQIKAGKLHPLAAGAPRRLSKYPGLPTFAELGYPGANMSSLFGIFARTGTDPAILKRVNESVNKALKDPKIVAILASGDNVSTGGTSQAFTADIERESASNAAIIKEANIQAQ